LDISLDIQLAFAGNVSMPMTIGHLATDVVHAVGVRYVESVGQVFDSLIPEKFSMDVG
jgi:hypothetical protein